MTFIFSIIVFGLLKLVFKDHKNWFEINKMKIGILLVICSIADLVIIYQLIKMV